MKTITGALASGVLICAQIEAFASYNCWDKIPDTELDTGCDCENCGTSWKYEYDTWYKCDGSNPTGYMNCNSKANGHHGWKWECEEEISYVAALLCYASAIGGGLGVGACCGGSFFTACAPCLVVYFGSLIAACHRCVVYDCNPDANQQVEVKGSVFADFGNPPQTCPPAGG